MVNLSRRVQSCNDHYWLALAWYLSWAPPQCYPCLMRVQSTDSSSAFFFINLLFSSYHCSGYLRRHLDPYPLNLAAVFQNCSSKYKLLDPYHCSWPFEVTWNSLNWSTTVLSGRITVWAWSPGQLLTSDLGTMVYCWYEGGIVKLSRVRSYPGRHKILCWWVTVTVLLCIKHSVWVGTLLGILFEVHESSVS